MKKKINYDLFRTNISVLRAAHGMSAKTLAEKIQSKSVKRILDLEENRGAPQMEEIFQISKVFGVTIDNLLFKKAHFDIVWKELLK